MDDRPPVWDASNREHILRDHPERGLSESEVNEVLADSGRMEIVEIREALSYHQVLGRTGSGRWLFVVWVDDPQGRYPVHVRQAGAKTRRRFER